jgi:hypothetical protein
MLQNYAQSDLYKPSNFFFYQDHVNGYNFRPIAQMISETPLQQPSKEGQGASQNQKYYFTSDTAVSRLSDSSIFSMKGFESIKDLDNFYNLQAGMFGSNLISHDLVTKSWRRYTYDYQKEFSKENHLYKNKLIRNGTQIIDFDNSERVINHLLPTDSFRKDSKWVKDHKSTLDLDFGRHVEENYLSRKSYLLQMDYLKLNISVIGDMRVVPGTVIELEFPDTSSTDNKRKNEKYSGKYLVTTVRHGFSLTEPRHLMHLEVVKDSFEKELTVDKKVDAPDTVTFEFKYDADKTLRVDNKVVAPVTVNILVKDTGLLITVKLSLLDMIIFELVSYCVKFFNASDEFIVVAPEIFKEFSPINGSS